jgi:5-methylphenazine-1-carboxylate 1-monooxygenase
MKIIISGAGIGGTALALMLHKRGFKPQVFESAATVRPLGVGINVQPSAIVELAQVGLLDELRATGIETSQVAYYSRLGQQVWAEPRGLAAGYLVPQFSIHRGELQMLLLETAMKRLDPGAVQTGWETQSVDPVAGKITLLQRSTGQTRTEQADIIVSADGIHSPVRRQFYPHEGPPKYSGCVLWRATTIGKPFLDGRTMVMAGNANHKLVTYPISQKYAVQGRSLINWIAELKVGGDTPPKDDWNREVDPELFAGAERVFEFPMVDRDPLPRWTHGRVTLLGDAAHPMYPIGSNGATQSILDARCLADEIEGAQAATVQAALERYEAERLPKCAKIVAANRAQGPDYVLEVFEQRAPMGFKHVHDVASQAELEEIALGYKRVVGLDIESVNQKARTHLGL